jgi:HEAT repeats
LASATLSEPLLRGIFDVSLAVFALCGMLMIFTVLLRRRFVARERAVATALDRWRPLLARAALGERVNAPAAGPQEGEYLLPLWNELRETVRGDYERSLDTFARATGLDRIAQALFASHSLPRRLLAINTLGYVGTSSLFAPLEAVARSPDPVPALAAARALLRLDAARALPVLVPLMLQREDWSVARLVAMLRGTDLARLELALGAAFGSARGRAMEKLLLLASVLPQDRTARWARMALKRAAGTTHINAALRLVSDPRDAPIVRRYLRHQSWQVRVRAVTALERVAAPEDLPRLVAALADREWWVRQRAARSLVRLPFLDWKQLERLCRTVSDRFARDALIQAIAEERAS